MRVVAPDPKRLSRRDTLRGVPPAARVIIESLQPYQVGDQDKARRQPLRVLHDLNNWDKHRLLTVVARYVRFPYAATSHGAGGGTGSAFLTIDGYSAEIDEGEDERW